MLISFLTLYYTMSAFGTKKPGADMAVQLTYPTVFQNVYASEMMPQLYNPRVELVGEMPLSGEDFLAHVHLQRKRDADAMAMAKVYSTRMMNQRAETGHAGYHLPRAVLGQRRFANPSNGSYFPYSSRQDYGDAPFRSEEGGGLEGGVLRTARGQAFGKAKLLDRIRQLNAISAAKSAFVGLPSVGGPTPAPSAVAPALPTALGDTSFTELAILLRGVQDVFTTSLDTARELDDPEDLTLPGIEKIYTDSLRAVSLTVRLASSPSTDELRRQLIALYNLIEGNGGILEKADAMGDPDFELQENHPRAFQQIGNIVETLVKLAEYLQTMLDPRIFNMSPKDKLTASKSETRRLDFSDLLKDAPPAPPPRAVADLPQSGVRAVGRGRGEAMSQSVADAYAEDWDGVGAFDGGETWRVAPMGANVSRFTRRGERREDTEHGSRRPTTSFEPSMREAFGYASGDFFPTGGRPMGFFGEAPELYGEAPFVAEAMNATRARALEAEQTRQTIDQAQARARGEEGLNTLRVGSPESALTAIRSVKSPETGEYDVISGVRTGKGKSEPVETFKLSRKDLPTTLDGFKQLSLDVEKKGGGKIRINKTSTLKNVRRNFIKRLGL